MSLMTVRRFAAKAIRTRLERDASMQLPGLFRSLGAMYTGAARVREYNFEPPHLALFDSAGMTAPCDQESRRRGLRVVPRGTAIAPFVRRRSEHLSFSPAEMPALAIDAGNQATVSIMGTDADKYEVRFCAQAGAANEGDARRSLEEITLERTSQWLKVRVPQYSRERPAQARLDVQAARHRAVRVNGSYSYTELFGIDAVVRLSTTHARMKLIEVAGDVHATAHVGIIDFAGDRGRIELHADGEIGEINLKFTNTLFDGTLDAEAEVAIRVLLPPACESSFEAVVERPDLFVCRADIAPRLRRQDRRGAVAFSYGHDDPLLRLISHGAMVIDTADHLTSPRLQ